MRRTGVLLAAGALAGCASLLGDFTASDQPTADGGQDGRSDAPEDAAADGAAADAIARETGAVDGPTGPSSEASDDGARATDTGAADGGGLLDCTSWAYPTPVVLETVSTGNRQVQGAVGMYLYNNGGAVDVRVIAGKANTNAFTLYSLDRTQTPPAVTALSSPTYFQSAFYGAHRGPGSSTYTVVVGSVRASGGVSPSFEAWVIPDSLASAGPLPAPFSVYDLTPTQATPTSIHILPLASNEIFTAITNPVAGTPATYSLGAGIATSSSPIGSLAPVASSLHADDFQVMQLFDDAVNNQVYFFSENDLASPGLSAWSIPDTAPPDAAAPTKRSVGALAASIQAIGENTTTSAADIAYVESTITSGVTTAMTVRVGEIAYSGASPNLDTWQSTDLAAARTYSGVGTLDAPFGVQSGSRWGQDNIMLLGPGLKSAADGGVSPGLVLLWVNSDGVIRSEERGANRLLTSINDFSAVTATPIAIAANGKTARWAVAWVETKTDDAGKYDVISYNELVCQ